MHNINYRYVVKRQQSQTQNLYDLTCYKERSLLTTIHSVISHESNAIHYMPRF